MINRNISELQLLDVLLKLGLVDWEDIRSPFAEIILGSEARVVEKYG